MTAEVDASVKASDRVRLGRAAKRSSTGLAVAGVVGDPRSPHPIAGPAVLGRPLAGGTPPAGRRSPVSPHLVGGTISIFGRTAFPFISDSLYPATNAVFQIPAGGSHMLLP